MKRQTNDWAGGDRALGEFRRVARSFGRRVRELRKHRGWSIEAAAQCMGLDSKHLWKIERAWRSSNVTLSTVVRIAVGFDEPVESLFRSASPSSREPTAMEASPADLGDWRVPADEKESERYRTTVPIFELEAAAGAFGSVQVVRELAWVRPPTRRVLRPGMFVAKVVGASMEPLIPSGSYCLFASPVAGSSEGRVVLVQHHGMADPETGGSYTVKRYHSEKVLDVDGEWRHTVVRLVPINPSYSPIVIHQADEHEVKVIAEVVDVLRR